MSCDDGLSSSGNEDTDRLVLEKYKYYWKLRSHLVSSVVQLYRTVSYYAF